MARDNSFSSHVVVEVFDAVPLASHSEYYTVEFGPHICPQTVRCWKLCNSQLMLSMGNMENYELNKYAIPSGNGHSDYSYPIHMNMHII